MFRKRVTSKELEQAVESSLISRGVLIEDIASIVFELQHIYQPHLTMEDCIDSVKSVLKKREVQHAILVGIELDVLAEKGLLSAPLQTLIATDDGLFGIDETIALGSTFTYGSVAATTFGFLDKNKIGIINDLDTKMGYGVHTFLDDLVASIAANASARIAHRERDKEELLEDGVELEIEGSLGEDVI